MLTAAFVVDSSVMVAIVNGEPEAQALEEALFGSDRYVGWPTIFETRIWTIRHQEPEFAAWLDAFLDLDNTLTIAFDRELEAKAADAFRRFGKGRHPARLNFGDCMTYAAAKSLDLPLLFKGADFGLTDVTIHPASVITAPAGI